MPVDDEAFLRAIGAAPEDDAPRLVYADWLDDRGDAARAEFIRVQCELARPGGDRGRRTHMRERERESLKAHAAEWSAAFPGCQVEFRRGLVEAVSGGADKLERLPSQLFAPGIVQEVRVTGPLRPATAVRGFTQMHGVKTLRLSSLALTSSDLIGLGMAEQFAALDVMDLRWNDITTDGFRELVADDLLPPGRTLLLGGNHFGPADRAELAEVLGDRVSFAVERPAEHLYRIGRGQNRLTGVDAYGRQVVITNTRHSRIAIHAFCFDLDGVLIAVEDKDRPPETYHIDSIDDDPGVLRLAARLGLVPGPVPAVRKFHHPPTGIRIADFTEEQWDLIHDPPPPAAADPEEAGRADAYRRLKYDWVPNGHFVFGEAAG
jgi:uncharacterized protein (TIGR02996 family)